MAILYYFVGIVGSGKTTIARNMRGENDLFLDSDALRAELLSGEEDQSNNALIFNEMQNRTVAALNRDQNVFYVACNIWSKKRIQFLKTLRQRVKIPFTAKCFLINTPIEICRERNSARSRVVPAYVIDRQIRQFQCPFIAEGFDEIEIVKGAEYNKVELSNEIWNKVKEMNSQDNPHHTLSLYDHLQSCIKNLDISNTSIKDSMNLLIAAGLHDIGKYMVKTYDEDGTTHYYNHAEIGAYLAMNMCVALEVIQLVNYHMLPYNTEGVTTWSERLGKDLWNKIMLLHDADKKAH